MNLVCDKWKLLLLFPVCFIIKTNNKNLYFVFISTTLSGEKLNCILPLYVVEMTKLGFKLLVFITNCIPKAAFGSFYLHRELLLLLLHQTLFSREWFVPLNNTSKYLYFGAFLGVAP